MWPPLGAGDPFMGPPKVCSLNPPETLATPEQGHIVPPAAPRGLRPRLNALSLRSALRGWWLWLWQPPRLTAPAQGRQSPQEVRTGLAEAGSLQSVGTFQGTEGHRHLYSRSGGPGPESGDRRGRGAARRLSTQAQRLETVKRVLVPLQASEPPSAQALHVSPGSRAQ